MAALELTASIHVGDMIHILGHSTDLKQKVTSLQVEHHIVGEAKPGDDVGMKVARKVHAHDKIFRIVEEEQG